MQAELQRPGRAALFSCFWAPCHLCILCRPGEPWDPQICPNDSCVYNVQTLLNIVEPELHLGLNASDFVLGRTAWPQTCHAKAALHAKPVPVNANTNQGHEG